MPRVLSRLCLLLACLLSVGVSHAGATPDVVLVVANGRHPWSVAFARRYLSARDLPASQLLTIDVAPDATVTREVYQQDIEGPIAAWLRDHDALDRTRVIVLGPGLPLRVAGTAGRNGTAASVDSELAILYRRLAGGTVAASGFVDNPYFSAGRLETPRPFDRATFDIYLVARLDGRTEAEAGALTARAQLRPRAFVVVVDGRSTESGGAEARWLAEVGPRVLAVRPDAKVIADATSDVIGNVEGVTGYASWGSNDARTRVPSVRFGHGAIASSFMSGDARTMAPPPPGWTPGLWSEPAGYFAGSPEALAADWLAAGLTGLGAQANEPYLDGAFRPATLLEAWARGYTLAESFYLAMPYLSWQAVVFGDPLARATDAIPAGGQVLTDVEAGAGAFVERMATALRQGQPGLDLETSRLMARANLSIAGGNRAEASRLLEQVTVRAPGYLAAQILLGQQYETEKQYDLARARYELVLQVQPANVVVLNNLAYNLGVHGGQPRAAVVHAERAAALAPNSPAVLDTLGWIRHLVGDSRGALGPLRRAVAGDPALCEAWDHLSQVESAVGNTAAATTAAERATACVERRGASPSRP